MTTPQPDQQLPSPKILLPLGIILIIGAVAAFVFFDLHLVSGLFAGFIGLAGAGMTVQSVMRLRKGTD